MHDNGKPPEDYYKGSDGASLPIPYEIFIKLARGVHILDFIHTHGYSHDYDVDSGMELEKARREFISRLLLQEQIPETEIREIWDFLRLYDAQPSFIKSILKKLT